MGDGARHHRRWIFGVASRGRALRSRAWLCGALTLLVACASGPRTPSRPIPSAIEQTDALIAAHAVDTRSPGWRERVPRPPPIRFPPNRTYYWMLFTSEGTLKIKLYPETAPRHVGTILYLTRLGFYDGLTFHRIVPKFMAQGGDPTGTGTGGPAFRYAGEFPTHAPKHDKRGVVSMANAGPRTDGSQFFILFKKEAPDLDGVHTVFGQVVEGFGTLRDIEMLGTPDGKPLRTVTIERAGIREE